jgi:hypothetical protein
LPDTISLEIGKKSEEETLSNKNFFQTGGVEDVN